MDAPGVGFTKEPVGLPYLNPNVFFSESAEILTLGKPGDPHFWDINTAQSNQLVPGKRYYAQAIVENTTPKTSTVFESPKIAVSFFLVQSATSYILSQSEWHSVALGEAIGAHTPSIPKQDDSNFHIFNAPFDTTAVPPTDHFCLVAVWYVDGTGNDFVDGNGVAKPGVRANVADVHVGWHNITILSSSHGRSSFAPVKAYSLADGSSSRVIVRPPNKKELNALHHSLGVSATSLCDGTSRSSVGLVEAAPNGTISAPDVKSLPLTLPIKNPQPGSADTIGVAVQLPEDIENDQEAYAAFYLVEQVDSEDVLIGGVAVVCMTERSLE